MSTFETALPAVSVGHGPTRVRSTSWQIFSAIREVPSILRGLWKPARAFRKHLFVVAIFNICIAGWGAALPLVLAWNIDTFVAGASYATIVQNIIGPFILITIPLSMLLPALRELYTVWYLRLPFKKAAGKTCKAHQRNLGLYPTKIRNKGPALKEGCDAAYEVIEFCTREPFHVIKGFFIAGYLFYYHSALLMGLVVAGVFVDAVIMLLMRNRLVVPISRMQDHEYRVQGMINRMLDGTEGPHGVSDKEYEHEWDAYILATKKAERSKLFYQTVWRGGMSQLFRISIALLVAWWVYAGQISVGDFLLLTALAATANDPFEIFLNFMWKLVTLREQLRRFGLLCGFDLGLAAAEGTITS
jgi:ABC-type bacteriocin/lantibiotic exporter with double-glycine peptidase domain